MINIERQASKANQGIEVDKIVKAKELIKQAFPNMLAGYRAGMKEYSESDRDQAQIINQWFLDWLKGARDLGIYKGPISIDIEFVRKDWE